MVGQGGAECACFQFFIPISDIAVSGSRCFLNWEKSLVFSSSFVFYTVSRYFFGIPMERDGQAQGR